MSTKLTMRKEGHLQNIEYKSGKSKTEGGDDWELSNAELVVQDRTTGSVEVLPVNYRGDLRNLGGVPVAVKLVVSARVFGQGASLDIAIKAIERVNAKEAKAS